MLYNFKCWINVSAPEQVRTLCDQLLNTCQFEVLGFMEHHFEPQGYTCIWLLGESHLAVHTYPEHGRAYLELTSCVASKNGHFETLIRSSALLAEETIA